MKSKTIIRLLLVVLWMFVIFWFSSYSGEESKKQSSRITYTVVNTFSNDKSELDKEKMVDSFSFVVRKIAHFLEYLVLGVLVYGFLKSIKDDNVIVLCILICSFYACIDEIHQFFVLARSSRLFDVFIDSCGAFTGIIIYYFLCFKKRSKINLGC